MKKPTNLAEAMVYVTLNEPFSSKIFTPGRKLGIWEQKMFEVNHCLLRIQINIIDFLDELRLISPGNHLIDPELKLRNVSVNLLIDLLKFAYIMEIPNYEEKIPVKESSHSDWVECLMPLKTIAIECAKFNHNSTYDNDLLRIAVLKLWKEFAGRIARKEMPWKMETLIAIIPEYMESE